MSFIKKINRGLILTVAVILAVIVYLICLYSARANDRAEIKAVTEGVPQAAVKVIIETCLLTREEKIRACRLVKQSGAAYAKTSTGFSKSGATAEDVKLMRETLGEDFGIKAAGGIRSRSFAEELVRGGADRIGASKSVEICKR